MSKTYRFNYSTGLRDYTVTSGSTEYIGARTVGSAYVSGADYEGDAAGFVLSAGGGTLNAGYAVDSAYIAAANGAAVSGAYAGSGASIDAVNQGYTYGATAGSSGAIAAASLIGLPVGGAGTAYNPRVLSGGYALTGGAPNLVIKGYKVQGSGGLLSGGTFDSGSQTIVGNGGTALGGNNSGIQWVQSGGQTSGGIFTGSGATQLNNGGRTSNSTAISGGLVQVSGAYGQGLTAMQGGTIAVQGGTYQGVLDNGLNGQPAIGRYAGGSGWDNNVLSGGTEVVGSGGQTTGSYIESGGQGTILNGGSAYYLYVDGGTEVVSSGGLLDGATVFDGGTVNLLYNGTANSLLASNGTVINDGGYIMSGATITQNGIADTLDGGTSNNYLVSQGGTGIAHSGGVVNNFSVNGGTGQVFSGGAAGTMAINGGTGNIYQGGLANTVNLSAGIGEVFQGGSVTNYNVNGGNALIDSGGYVGTLTAGPSENASALVQPGANVNTLAATGYGSGVLSSGASVASAVTPANGNGNGGVLFLSGTAGIVSGTDNGIINTLTGASFSSFSLNGATAYLTDGYFATPPTVTGSNGTMMVETHLSNLSASSGGTAVLSFYANAHTATGGPGGTIIAQSGAQGDQILLNGGQGTVLSGANISSMNILAGGNGVASNGASLDWMYVSSGNGTLQSGATVRHLRIQPGGSGFLMSGASALDISVASGGWISGAVVKAGNSMSVASAGTAVNTIVTDSSANAGANPTSILSGGSAVNTVLAGANPTGGTAALGGLLTIQSGANLSNTSMGYNARLRVLGLQYDKGGTTYLSGGTLHVIENGQEWTTTLQGSYHGKNASDSGFILLDDGQGNTIVAYDQCFLAGTLIRLEQGDVAVEDIQKGDIVRVLNNGQEELREITNVVKRHAHVHTDLPKDMAGWSVKIDKDAFAEGVPSQDLSVTPEHCFYFDGRFVPARMLVNHQTIRYDLTQPEYDFYHIETQPHSVIWANNTLTESYLDTGERPHIENDEEGIARIRPSRRLTWTEDAAAPLDVTQAFVEPLFKQFEQRAVDLGHPAHTSVTEHDMSDDPDLRVQLDNGMTVLPTRRVGDRVLFSFPASEQQTVRLLSRRFKPSESIGPFVDDRRTLGVLVGSIELWTGGHEDAITEHLTNPELTGWDVREAGPHRWTRGNAIIPLPDRQVATGEMRMLSVQIQAGGPYILSTADTMQEIAAS